jgi:hypothetical protein
MAPPRLFIDYYVNLEVGSYAPALELDVDESGSKVSLTIRPCLDACKPPRRDDVDRLRNVGARLPLRRA